MSLTTADLSSEAFLGRVVLFGHLSEEQYVVYQIPIRQDLFVTYWQNITRRIKNDIPALSTISLLMERCVLLLAADTTKVKHFNLLHQLDDANRRLRQ